jgi:hypothetical protein
VLDCDPGDINTIEDQGSVEEARWSWVEMKGALERAPAALARDLSSDMTTDR